MVGVSDQFFGPGGPNSQSLTLELMKSLFFRSIRGHLFQKDLQAMAMNHILILPSSFLKSIIASCRVFCVCHYDS